MQTPSGIEEIVATFGDIHQYVDSTGVLSQTWSDLYLSIAELPFSLPLAWNPSVSVTRITCHKLLVKTFEQVFQQIQSKGLQDKLTSYGGCFAYRPQRTGTKLSTHAWGIAVDLNPGENEQGTIGNMDPGIVEIFEEAGFRWGGDWLGKVKDPMHMQFATGY